MSYILTPINELQVDDIVRLCYSFGGKEKYISGSIETIHRFNGSIVDLTISFIQKQYKKPTTMTFFYGQIIKVYVQEKLDCDLGI